MNIAAVLSPRNRGLLAHLVVPQIVSGIRHYKPRVATKKLSCDIAGKPTCVRAFARLIGIGSAKIERVRKGERSLLRDPKPKHPVLGVSLRVGSPHPVKAWRSEVYLASEASG